jgi:hypothetical protein
MIMIVLIVLFVLSPVMSADYEPYHIDEFPQWSIKLRRAETLFFGSLPITLGVTGLAYSAVQLASQNTWFSEPVQDSLTVLSIAGILSLGIALADYIVGEMQ